MEQKLQDRLDELAAIPLEEGEKPLQKDSVEGFLDFLSCLALKDAENLVLGLYPEGTLSASWQGGNHIALEFLDRETISFAAILVNSVRLNGKGHNKDVLELLRRLNLVSLAPTPSSVVGSNQPSRIMPEDDSPEELSW